MFKFPPNRLLSRRATLFGAAASGVYAAMMGRTAVAQDRYDLEALLRFNWPGQVSLLHIGPLKGILTPHFYRPSARRISAASTEETLSGEALRVRYGVGGLNPMDYALTHERFDELARIYGEMGGIANVATVLNGIRRSTPEVLVLSTCDDEKGPLGHFRGGAKAVRSVVADLNADVMMDPDKGSAIPAQMFERGGMQIAVVQFAGGRSTQSLDREVSGLRAEGYAIIICMSTLSMAQGRMLVQAVRGIDLLLVNDVALPEAVEIGETRIISSGAQGRFVSRFDFDVVEGKLAEVEQVLIPVFAEIIESDIQMSAAVAAMRAPFHQVLDEVIGTTEVPLFQADGLHSSWDDLICAALRADLTSDFAMWPARGGGQTVLAGQDITREAILSATGETQVRKAWVTGDVLKQRLEEEAGKVTDAAIGDGRNYGMIRTDGLAYTLDLTREAGARIVNLARDDGTLIESDAKYSLATSSGSRQDDLKAADIVEGFIKRRGRVRQKLGGDVDVVLLRQP